MFFGKGLRRLGLSSRIINTAKINRFQYRFTTVEIVRDPGQLVILLLLPPSSPAETTFQTEPIMLRPHGGNRVRTMQSEPFKFLTTRRPLLGHACDYCRGVRFVSMEILKAYHSLSAGG
jgi:hypothetical protein